MNVKTPMLTAMLLLATATALLPDAEARNTLNCVDLSSTANLGGVPVPDSEIAEQTFVLMKVVASCDGGDDCHTPETCDNVCGEHADACEPCDFDDPGDSQYCHQLYCQQNPNSYPCQGTEAECGDGFFRPDSDGDGVCDRDDIDDDGDGVPDDYDPSPHANNAVDDAYSCAIYFANRQQVCV